MKRTAFSIDKGGSLLSRSVTSRELLALEQHCRVPHSRDQFLFVVQFRSQWLVGVGDIVGKYRELRVRMTLHVSLSSYSQKRAHEWWIGARYLEDQAPSLQDQIPQASPLWNLIEISQERKNAHEKL